MARSTLRAPTFVCVVALMLATGGVARAEFLTFRDRGAFTERGVIAHTNDFEDFGQGFSYPDSWWTAQGVTYVRPDNLVIGTGTFHEPVSNVLAVNSWSPLVGLIESRPDHYDMFAFDLGYISLWDPAPINLILTTDRATYRFDGLIVPRVSDGLNFYGFVASPGEYFTHFSLFSPGILSGPAIDNVTLGNATNTPEPGTLALLGVGAACLSWLAWRRRASGGVAG